MKTNSMIALAALAACTLAVSAQHQRLTDLPHLYIETFNGQAVTSKTTEVPARIWLVTRQDSVLHWDSLGIRGRGNSTWNMAKKPYRLRFPKKERFLGPTRANARKWTLLANHGDKALIRNALTSRLGDFVGLPFNPAAEWVDLTLNGQYQGTYQVSDHIDVRRRRVDVEEQDVPTADTSDITGGYLLEADGFKDFSSGTDGFYSRYYNAALRIHYPDRDDIAPSQFAYIAAHVRSFEEALRSATFPDDGAWHAYVDSTTLANWYIATEVSANIDGFFSTYLYKHRGDDRFYWGPLWDYDIAYANDNRKGDTSRQLMVDVGYGSDAARPWVERMWQDPWFQRLIARRYDELLGAGLESFMLRQTDSLAAVVQASAERNYQRWGISSRTLREVVLYSSYDDYVAYLRRFIQAHVPYLRETFRARLPEGSDADDSVVPYFDADPTTAYTIANAGTATVLAIDAATDLVEARRADAGSHTQQWTVEQADGGYYIIINRATGYALADPTEGEATATTNVGSRLTTAVADRGDKRQHWNLVPQGNERWNLVSRHTRHAANLSGGSAADGTAVLSYTSDSRDATSANRLWHIEPARDGQGNSVVGLDGRDADYILTYDPATARLHFRAATAADVPFAAHVVDSSGRLCITFQAADGASLARLPHGLYIVTWHDARGQHSAKVRH